jgi:WD40 repeat protein
MQATTQLLLDNEINDIEYSTYYRDVCCVGTMNHSHFFHGGDLYLYHMSTENHKFQQLGGRIRNRVGIHTLTWSEHYVQTIVCGNHDGTIHFWNVNKGKRLVSLQADKGYPISAVDWNHLDHNYILSASSSSRVKLFDISNLDYISSSYMEHTKAVNDAKWNTNNKDEFATVSDDGLLKIWDRRTADQSSVNTLMDRTDPAPLSCVDWHKKDDWLIGVGNKKGQVLLWDTRNYLQPLQRRYTHGTAKRPSIVTDIRFDTNNSQRFATCSDDHSVRIWKVSDSQQQQGVYLTQEHKLHRKKVNAIDWNIHNAESITSASSDYSLICCSLSSMVQVTEYEKDGKLIAKKDRVTTPKKELTNMVSQNDFQRSAL